MLFKSFILLMPVLSVVLAIDDPLAYRTVATTYAVPTPSNASTLWEFINSRSDLSSLKTAIEQDGGFLEAFNTIATWKWTFFASNNDAFANAGRYFSTFEATRKGNGGWETPLFTLHSEFKLKASQFIASYQRFQTTTYLFVGAQMGETKLVLNDVAEVVKSDIQVDNVSKLRVGRVHRSYGHSKGVIHIIDKILDPSAQIYEPDHPWMHQSFIAGSCSNLNLPYC